MRFFTSFPNVVWELICAPGTKEKSRLFKRKKKEQPKKQKKQKKN
jgi:hypothetical protein